MALGLKGLKNPSLLRAVPCFQYVTQTRGIHKGSRDCREEQFGTPCSPINAPLDHEMYPGGLTASVQSRL